MRRRQYEEAKELLMIRKHSTSSAMHGGGSVMLVPLYFYMWLSIVYSEVAASILPNALRLGQCRGTTSERILDKQAAQSF